MNTKLILTSSALVMAVFGLATTFMPQEILQYSGVQSPGTAALFLQVTGALYLGLAMMNWMSRSGLIGGIYARPLAMANFMHFTIGALALIKGLVGHSDSVVVSVGATAYLIFAVLFGLILFRHPLPPAGGS